MNIIELILLAYVVAYTALYGKHLWSKDNNKLGGTFLIMISLSIIGLYIYIKYFD